MTFMTTLIYFFLSFLSRFAKNNKRTSFVVGISKIATGTHWKWMRNGQNECWWKWFHFDRKRVHSTESKKKLSLTEKQEELPFVSGKMKKASSSSSSPRNRTIIITNIISYRYRVERKKVKSNFSIRFAYKLNRHSTKDGTKDNHKIYHPPKSPIIKWFHPFH